MGPLILWPPAVLSPLLSAQAHDSVRRLGEVQQSEQFLRARVEELECSEQSLREAVHHSDSAKATVHRKTMEQASLRHSTGELAHGQDYLTIKLPEHYRRVISSLHSCELAHPQYIQEDHLTFKPTEHYRRVISSLYSCQLYTQTYTI